MANGAQPGQAPLMPRANPVRLQPIRTNAWATIRRIMFNSSAARPVAARQFFAAPVAPSEAYLSGHTTVMEGDDVRRQVLAATAARQQARYAQTPDQAASNA
jgi:hypothetical protein